MGVSRPVRGTKVARNALPSPASVESKRAANPDPETARKVHYAGGTARLDVLVNTARSHGAHFADQFGRG
jgi:hypothetical protein